jgi:hypothetical protein
VAQGLLRVVDGLEERARVETAEGGDDLGVELLARLGDDLLDRLLERPRLLVRARVREDVEDVGDGGDAAGQRDRVAGQAVGVAGAVPALVVGAGDLLGEAQDRRAAAERMRRRSRCAARASCARARSGRRA